MTAVGGTKIPAAGSTSIVESTGSISAREIPTVAERVDLYKAWKTDNAISGLPTLKEFELFDDPSRLKTNFKSYVNSEWSPKIWTATIHF